jgi:proteasome lid subunit RPN8/RPN11
MTPTLRFTPYAWAKLIWFRDRGNTEIGGFGITTKDDPLFVYDIAIPKQEVSSAFVEFNDNAVSDHFEDMFDQGIQPANCGRIWIHTHPAGLARPSSKDEETFARVFGKCDWAVMFILPKQEGHYCRVNFNTPIEHSIEIPYKIEFGCTFGASDIENWEETYKECINKRVIQVKKEEKGEGKQESISEYFRRQREQDKNNYFNNEEDNWRQRFSENKKTIKKSLYEDEEIDSQFDDLYRFNAGSPTKGKKNGKKSKD